MSLTDFQIGLIQGLGVALFAACAGYPIAWLADRFDRRLILSASVLVWCAAVAACGLSQSFPQLFVASAIVGVGEASLLPITYAVIPTLFEGRSRLTANAMVTLVGRVASGGVIALIGLLVQQIGAVRSALPHSLVTLENWRLALLALAVPGPLFALAVLSLRLSKAPDKLTATQQLRSTTAAWPYLRAQIGTLGAIYAGVGLLIFGMSAFGAFMPVVAMRQMGASPASVGAGVGTATLISTLAAMVIVIGLGGTLARRLGPAYTIWLLASASCLTALLSPAFLFVRSANDIYVLMGVSFLFLGTGAMAFPTALQDLIPAPLRARLIAVAILVNIILSALAPGVVGFVSDQLGQSGGALLVATVATAMAALVAATVMLALASRRYVATVDAARQIEINSEQGL
ncbi:MFS transporter [Novosphingobium sp. Gsoil 351]|uniref:MFS transporter n=1 Tax=Novosphingobium sp. Gsoil 351 TaxID=2675225 RepID=UPI0012B45479|nr:MFS transporter [Novosphingobium sp. Gsoil 351]QGN55632.1 MFS transporter [Novosphingobium sp. Gsoil 351]